MNMLAWCLFLQFISVKLHSIIALSMSIPVRNPRKMVKLEQRLDLQTIDPPSSGEGFARGKLLNKRDPPICWASLPQEADPHYTTWRSHGPHESGGELTPRGQRKRVQVENFLLVLTALLEQKAEKDRKSITVVDFGCGTGNLVPPFDFLG